MLKDIVNGTDAFSTLLRFLETKGYKEGDSLVLYPVLSTHKKTIQPDILLVDPERDQELALIELEFSNEESVKKRALEQMLSFREALPNPLVQLFLAFQAEHGKKTRDFEFYRVTKNNEMELIPSINFPTYSSLATGRRALDKTATEEIKKRNIDFLQIICFMLAFISLLGLVLDVFFAFHGIKLLTTERITLLGFIMLLSTLPFAAKLKVFGIEFERKKEIKKK